MNINQLKKFAQEARRKLLEQVGAKLNFVLTTDSAELREKTEQLKQLRLELVRTTKEQLIEKVAYTWFNRLMAIRFMDANDYQPLGIRILTPKDGYTIPELLDEAKRGNIPDELKVNRQKIYDLLDNKIPSSNPQNEAYKELVIASCNHLHTTFPFLFEKINDYTELLLPDDLTSDFAIVKDVQDGMPDEDCKNVEIIGWLYQFYISEKKDEVFASKSKVMKADIPAATQLFTPRWIVEYLVQNTLGKLWLQNRPKSRLREHMPFFVEYASGEAGDFLKFSSPEEIKFLDPASGSGHILVYAFDLFCKIYEEEGYSTNEIPQLIIENNLYGFEIDERAAQLSGLALMMKAREYQRRILRKGVQPNIYCFKDIQITNLEIKETFKSLNITVSESLLFDLQLFQHSTNFGSLIFNHSKKEEISEIAQKLDYQKSQNNIFQKSYIEEIINAINKLLIISNEYHCVVTNPPYMGGGNMNNELSDFVKTEYPISKSDLMVCFMERGYTLLKINGYLGMINMPSWMFLSSFEKYRKSMLRIFKIESLIHLGRGIFGADFGTVAFTFRKNSSIVGKGVYRRLFEQHVQVRSVDTIRNLFLDSKFGYYIATQEEFLKIPSAPIAYWLNNNMFNIFTFKGIEHYLTPKFGMSVGDGQRFIRYGFEVSSNRWLRSASVLEQFSYDHKWASLDKGGEFRRWYGNQQFVVNWSNNGKEIRNHKKSAVRSPQFFLQKHISWTLVSAGAFSVRYFDDGFLLDTASNCLYFNSKEEIAIYTLGLLNSVLADSILSVLNPTINYSCGVIGLIPFKLERLKEINPIVEENITISKQDWDVRELSWDFKRNALIRLKGQDIEESYDLFIEFWKTKFFKLHQNEEELNKLFINIYGLSGDLVHLISLDRITLLQDELNRNSLKNLSKKLIRKPETLLVQNYHEISLPFLPYEIISQFISYSVGCILGRFSLDKEGLILANQGETLESYLQKIEKTGNECSLLPDADNIIPVLDTDWFEDDIVGKFNKFLKVTFGEKNFKKNLTFIEEQVGKDIRKYFIKDFYADHVNRYKKRPIYWMFSSPEDSFNVLIYMHRYTPDTVSDILNKYLKEFIGKLNTRKEHLQHVQVTGSSSDKTKAIKEIGNIDKMLVELHDYERDILYPLAAERIEIDLDDGVLVNYNKFGKAVKEVNGLNDPTTKKKVRQFDWIDASQIR